jgi:hypothetical protein
VHFDRRRNASDGFPFGGVAALRDCPARLPGPLALAHLARGSLTPFTIPDPGVRNPEMGVHVPDCGVHDGPIYVLTILRNAHLR